GGERGKLVHHGVDGVLEFENLAFDVDGDLARQVRSESVVEGMSDVTHLVGEVAGHGVDGVGQVFPGTGDAGHVGLAAQVPFGADFGGHAGHFGGERGKLVHHGVDGVLEFENLAFDVDGDLARQV